MISLLQVVADSSCDLPQVLIEANDIEIVPLTIHVNNRSYLEGSELTAREFYKEMAKDPHLPKTSQPAPAAFAQAFRRRAQLGEVLCLTISSGLSGTFEAAKLGGDLSGVDAVIFDTLAGSLGHGLQVLMASKMARAGAMMAEIVAELEEYRKRMKIFILLNTLENIVKGGRLNKFQGAIASVLNIKLLLHNIEGKVELLERVRGNKKFIRRVMETIWDYCPDLSGRDVGITDFLNPKGSKRIQEEMQGHGRPRNIITNDMGATMATYAGEGGMIIAL